MKFQFIQNFSNINITSPKKPKKIVFKRKPVPSLGKSLKLTFWYEKPYRKITNKPTMSVTTKPVNIAGGSSL